MRLQRWEWAAALLITLFAVGLHRLRLVHAGPLWRDEADLLKVKMAEPDPLADVLGAVERTLRSGHRVWAAGNIEIPPPGAALFPLDRQHWSQRFGTFLRDHAAQGGRVPVPWNGPVNGYERMELLVLSGWRTPG